MRPLDIEICDVTLRDGEQTPGVSFTCQEKLDIAHCLDTIGVEVIEAGFPSVSENEKKCIKEITKAGLDARICCLSRAMTSDVDAAIDCDVDLVSIFFATSDLHLRVKYKKTREEMLAQALDMVDYAVDHGLKVRFSAEDGSRTDVSFLMDMFEQGYEHKAAYSSLADTVGCMTPLQTADIVSTLTKNLKNRLCVHFHNDMGLATANTFTAAECGAFQLHTTVNGIGERAGNASLEELLVALRMKGGVDRYDLTQLTAISKMVSEYSGLSVPKTKAVVGENAFSHESGIHIAALLVDRNTYEYFQPEMVGGEQRFVLGKHTGRKALEHVVRTLGCELDDAQMERVLHDVKVRSEGKCVITPKLLKEIIRNVKETV
ncbi:MAG: homocitrate synthase family protein [Candidatus Methanomethylophilaceae archaeon]